MKCTDAEIWMNAVIDGEASDREKDELLRHIAACNSCRRKYAELSELQKAVEGLTVEPPEELHARIMQAVSAQKKKKKTFVTLYKVIGAAAAAALLCVSAAVFLPGLSGSKKEADASATAFDAAFSGKKEDMELYAAEPSGNNMMIAPAMAPPTADMETAPAETAPTASPFEKRAAAENYAGFYRFTGSGSLPEGLSYEKSGDAVFVTVPKEKLESVRASLIGAGFAEAEPENAPEVSPDADLVLIVIEGGIQ